MVEIKSPGNICVIGAAGRVGLPFSLVLAGAGHSVWGIDINETLVATLNAGHMPYVENGGQELLIQSLEAGRLRFTGDVGQIGRADVIVLMLGTPVDSELNPRLDVLLDFFRANAGSIGRGQMIMLRSTVAPGTTDLVRSVIDSLTGLRESEDYHLVFAPERVAEGRGIEESRTLPNLVGAFSDAGYERARHFFESFAQGPTIKLTPREAEMGKLITNMARYVNFALANEFFMLCNQESVSAHRIIEACNHEYPRLDLPKPGANVGGPCLYKDGYFLVDGVPFGDLIRTAFTINEGVPRYLLDLALKRKPIRRAAILGMTFKANIDDTRHSLSYRLKKRLSQRNIETVEVDPYLRGCEDWSRMRGVDAAFLMTPHEEFRDLPGIAAAIANPDCLMVDMWNLWAPSTSGLPCGFFTLREGGYADEDTGNRLGGVTYAVGDPTAASGGT